MKKLNYADLCAQFAKKTGYSTEVARHQLDVLRGIIGSAVVSGYAVTLPGLLMIKPAMKPAKPARKVAGRPVAAQPAHMGVKAQVSKTLKDAVKARWGVNNAA